MRAKLADERELIAAPRAVQHRHGARGLPAQDMVDHGAQRRDAGAARDKQQPRLGGSFGNDEGSKRTVDINQCSDFGGRQVRPELAIRLEGHQQLQPTRFRRALRRTGDRVRTPFRLSMRPDEHRLPGQKLEGTVAKVDDNEPRSGSLDCDIGKRNRDDWHSAEV
jgi:hypothetical protein